jgi:hypothetical protein
VGSISSLPLLTEVEAQLKYFLTFHHNGSAMGIGDATDFFKN